MVFPSQSISIRDPGIGAAQGGSFTPIMTGIAHGGSKAVNTLQSISDPAKVRAEIGYGQLAEDVALALQQFGGPVYYVIHNSAQNVALTAFALTKLIGTGPTVVADGSPNDYYSIRVEIVAGGTLGTATFKFSLDGWDSDIAPFTYSQVRATVASYVIPNTGITLTFPAGTYVAGDVYTLTTLPQEVGTVDLATVAALLIAQTQLDIKLWAVSGIQPLASTAATVAAALSGHLTSLTNTFRFARAFIDDGSSDTAPNAVTSAANWTSSRVCASYGNVLRTSALPFEGFSTRKAPSSAGIAVRAFGSLISTDLSRVADGPDEGVLKIFYDANSDTSLDDVKISTMRRWPGLSGFYITNAKLHSAFGSDFTDLQFGRVMDVACRTTYLAQVPFQSSAFRTTDTGTIEPKDAARVEAVVQRALDDELINPLNAEGVPGHVSEVNYDIDLLVNIVTTSQLQTTVGIRPLGYAKKITTTLFFTLNP